MKNKHKFEIENINREEYRMIVRKTFKKSLPYHIIEIIFLSFLVIGTFLIPANTLAGTLFFIFVLFGGIWVVNFTTIKNFNKVMDEHFKEWENTDLKDSENEDTK